MTWRNIEDPNEYATKIKVKITSGVAFAIIRQYQDLNSCPVAVQKVKEFKYLWVLFHVRVKWSVKLTAGLVRH